MGNISASAHHPWTSWIVLSQNTHKALNFVPGRSDSSSWNRLGLIILPMLKGFLWPICCTTSLIFPHPFPCKNLHKYEPEKLSWAHFAYQKKESRSHCSHWRCEIKCVWVFLFCFLVVFFFFLREMEGKNKNTQNRTLLEKRMKINQQWMD